MSGLISTDPQKPFKTLKFVTHIFKGTWKPSKNGCFCQKALKNVSLIHALQRIIFEFNAISSLVGKHLIESVDRPERDAQYRDRPIFSLQLCSYMSNFSFLIFINIQIFLFRKVYEFLSKKPLKTLKFGCWCTLCFFISLTFDRFVKHMLTWQAMLFFRRVNAVKIQ